MVDQEKRQSPWGRLRRILIGKPIPTSKAHHERLGPFIGLPVFSSDSLSSVAYATEAILSILILMSIAALNLQLPVTLAICLLIVIIAISYQQTIHAYPNGGGSYIVASENLGEKPGLVAGAALLIDYILTVAVSVAAGVAALTSAFPHLHPFLIPIALLFVALIAWANLRGVRESGAVFAVPTYAFIFGTILMLGWGIAKVLTGNPVEQTVRPDPALIGSEANALLWFIVLRSFAAGCTALTGIEAVSNGVQAFRAPESKNAAITLRWMAALLMVMFLGMGYLAQHIPQLTLYRVVNPEYQTVMSQVAMWVFGPASIGFYFIQFATAAILVLAANTAFADFPRLASLIARDGYLPRPLARQGDRLVFHNGIIVLALAAAVLIVVFRGELDLLLPLYAVGVFTAFTLSQTGMVMHWRKLRTLGWRRSIAINGLGAVLSAIVLVIILFTKFLEGAWLVAVMLPGIVMTFVAVKRRYAEITRQLVEESPEESFLKQHEPREHLAILLVPRVHRGILQALEYAQNLKGDCTAVHVIINEKAVPVVRRDWERHTDVPLVVLSSPYRSLIEPVLDYVDELREAKPRLFITVVVAEAVAQKFFHRFLQENVAQQIKNALSKRRNVVVSSVRYFLD